jgi:hypothetical protein
LTSDPTYVREQYVTEVRLAARRQPVVLVAEKTA